MNIFTNGKGLTAGPVVNPGIDNWKSLGCYTDSISERTFEFLANVESVITATRCTSACQQAGYTYAGMEYAGECYCGNSMRCPSAPTDASACNMVCNGNSTELCGGPDALNVYQLGNDPIKACSISSSTTSTSSAAAPTATTASLCPGSNNTIQTDASGEKYTTYCDYDFDGGVLQVGDLASYELCLEMCDTLDTCGAVAWTGGDGRGFCYLKEPTVRLITNKKVMAAVRMSKVTSTSSSALASSSSVSSSALSSLSLTSATSSSIASSSVSSTSPSAAPTTPVEPSSLAYPNCAAPPNNIASGACQCGFEFTQDTKSKPNFAAISISIVDSLSSCINLCDNTFTDCIMGDYDCVTGTCRIYPQGGGTQESIGQVFFSKELYSCPADYNNGVCTGKKFVATAPFVAESPVTVSSSSSVLVSSSLSTAVSSSSSAVVSSSSMVSSSTTLSMSSSTSSAMTAPPVVAVATTTPSAASTLRTISVNVISTTTSVTSSTVISTTSSSTTPSSPVTLGPYTYGTNGCPRPTPVSFTISSTLFNYNMCNAYFAPAAVNLNAPNLAACAASCTGNCRAFLFGGSGNCRTMNQVNAITTSYYAWSAYQLIGATPLPTAN